jgi:UDP-N-acetylmuramoylalanine--D-glutamate ligase
VTWDELRRLASRNVHVVGLASTEGAAMVRFLYAEGVRRLTAHDFQSESEVETAFLRMHVGLPRPEREALWREIASLPIERQFGERYLDGIETADAVFVSQAWYLYPPNLPRLADLRRQGVPFHSLAELYFDLSPAPIVAVTGSNGKSTTSRLIESILRRTGRPIYYAGNERRSVQVLDRLRQMEADAVLVLEISNRQLADVEPRPHIGVVTTILPNHLDEHEGSFERYAAVKRKLVATQRPDDFAVLNADDPGCRAIADGLPAAVWWFSRLGPVPQGAWLADGHIWLRAGAGAEPTDAGHVDLAHLPGVHNESNVLAAVTAAWLAGASTTAIAEGIASFRGLRHRLQLVWRANGVEYYDDLNATTPQATAAALRTLPAPVILIAGGDDKGLDLGELVELVVERVPRLVLLPGTGSDRIEAGVRDARTDGSGPRIDRFESLEWAVADVVAHVGPGSRVLLSPACPFFFSRHYLGDGRAETGFRALLRRLAIESDQTMGESL